jgi:hypothetical protein
LRIKLGRLPKLPALEFRDVQQLGEDVRLVLKLQS